MKLNRQRAMSGCAIIALVLSGAQAQAQEIREAEAVAETAAQPELAEIIVTAQRRSSNLIETPVAVSAFGSDFLRDRNIEDLRDLKSLVPGMQLGDSYGTAAISIRGIGTVEVLQGADPGVAYHIDGVYIGRAQLAAAAFFDVDQIEILRGPQGVSFGRNSTGGSVNFIPARPTDVFEGSVSFGVDVDPFAYQLEGVVSGPLTDAVRGRLSVQRQYNKGFTENLNDSGPQSFDDRDSLAVRGQLGFKLSDALEANLLVEHYDGRSTGPGHFLVGTPSGTTPIGIALGGSAPDITERKLFSNYGLNDLEYTGAILKLMLDTGAGTLTSSSSYYKSNGRFVNDFDGTEVDFTSTDISNDSEQIYQELLFSSDFSDRIDLVLGANLFYEDSAQTVDVPITVPGSPTLNILIASDIETWSYAGFGFLTVHATDTWDLFGGLRYTYDDKKARRQNNFVGAGFDKADWDAFTYELGTSLEIAPRTNVYLKYSKGYKGGGFESSGPGAPPFNPEYIRSWEAGLKTQLFERRIQAAFSAFSSKYDDLQVNQIVGVSNTVTNAASASIKGAELELLVRPTHTLTFQVAASYLDAEFDEFVTADAARPALGQLDLAGNRLRNSPEYTLSGDVAYTIPLSAGQVTLRGRYYRQGKMFFSEFNIPISSQSEVDRVDIGVDFETEDKLWKGSLYATNLTDEIVFNDVVVVSDILGSSAFAKLDAGRRIGISLTRRF